MRRSKSEVRPSDLKMAEDEFNKKNETGKDGQVKELPKKNSNHGGV